MNFSVSFHDTGLQSKVASWKSAVVNIMIILCV